MPRKKLGNACQIIPGIWIGDDKVARDYDFFKEKNIEAVLNCAADISNVYADKGIEYMHIILGDSRDPSDLKLMSQYLDHAVSFMEKNHDVEGKNILVHCNYGINRSSTCVSAYLIKNYGMKFRDTKKFLPTRREQCYYNGSYATFEQQLRQFEKKYHSEAKDKKVDTK